MNDNRGMAKAIPLQSERSSDPGTFLLDTLAGIDYCVPMDTDWYTQQRAIAQLHFDWLIDKWKWELGMLEVYSHSDHPITAQRRLRNTKPIYGPQPEPFRMLPLFNGYCLLVRDKR